MRTWKRSDALILLAGDVVVFALALATALFLRFGTSLDEYIFALHAAPFSILFVVWVLVFFAAGLYEKHTSVLQSRVPVILLNAQLVNIALAAVLFYLVPAFGITPKTILFLCLVISFPGVVLWRMVIAPLLFIGKRSGAILLGHGVELTELKEEVNRNPRYPIEILNSIDIEALSPEEVGGELKRFQENETVSVIVADTDDARVRPLLPAINARVLRGARIFNFYDLYEDLFDRVSLELLDSRWGVRETEVFSRSVYDAIKRLMDIVLGALGLVLSAPFSALAIILIALDDGAPAFIRQERLGQGGKKIHLWKFRTMHGSGDRGKWIQEGDMRITRAGGFLRKTRIDELPQLWNVLWGDISLIGPRPDVIGLGEQLMRDIPHYMTRYLVKPGLSGWAQIKQDLPPQSLAETKLRLSYDLYYLKHRSLWLDLKIVFQTIKTLLSRSGK